MTNVFADHFMQVALIAGLVVGVVCAYFGVHVVLRRIVFVGAALAQVSSAGVALAMLTNLNSSLVALLLTMGGVAAFSAHSRDRRVAQENLIGVGYAVASALAVLFVAKSAQGESHLLDVLSGNVLTVDPTQLGWAAGLSITAVIVHLLFHKQFLFSAFDSDTAQAAGYRVAAWDLLFFVLLGTVVALSIRLAGTLLVFGFLVLPALTGLALSRHLTRIYLIAIASATAATVGGLYASFVWDLPSGPAIVACSLVLLLLGTGIGRLRR